jgi:hypothetical protein
LGLDSDREEVEGELRGNGWCNSSVGKLAFGVVGLVLVVGYSTSADRAAITPSPAAAIQPRAILRNVKEAHVEGPIQTFDTDVVVGPISWPQLQIWATADPSGYVMSASGNDFKIGAQVKAGATVTVSVAPEARAYAGLDYGQASGYRQAPAVTFHSCVNSDTVFVGGFHVEGRHCVPFDVIADSQPPVRIVMSFFNGPCAP